MLAPNGEISFLSVDTHTSCHNSRDAETMWRLWRAVETRRVPAVKISLLYNALKRRVRGTISTLVVWVVVVVVPPWPRLHHPPIETALKVFQLSFETRYKETRVTSVAAVIIVVLFLLFLR